MLKPFCSFSLPGTVASLSADAGIGGGATGASFIAASVFGRPISGDPGGSGCGLSAGALAAGAGLAGAGVGCCAKAGAATTRVPRVPASSIARRLEDRNVIVILPDAEAVLSATTATVGPHRGQFPTFAIGTQSPKWPAGQHSKLCDKRHKFPRSWPCLKPSF